MARLKSGTLTTLILALLALGSSLWLGASSNAVECDRLPPLSVLAILAAFVLALGFRQLARVAKTSQRGQLIVALVLAGATFFGDVHFIVKYRGPCQQIQRQIRELSPGTTK